MTQKLMLAIESILYNVEQENKQNDNEALGDDRQQGGDGDIAENELADLSGTQTLNLVKGSSTGVDYYA